MDAVDWQEKAAWLNALGIGDVVGMWQGSLRPHLGKITKITKTRRMSDGRTPVLPMATVAEVCTFAERFQAENSTMLGRGDVPIWRDAVSRAIGRAFRDPRHMEVVRDPVEIEGILNYLDRVQHVINAAWADGTPAP